jgi:ABC-type transport system involved in cytochrome bd biosynthesis fused ATPase/permease subunit
MISLRYALTKEDFANFSVYVQIDAPGKKKMLFKTFWPVIIILVIIGTLNIVTAAFSQKLAFSDFIGIPVVLLLFLYPILSAKPRIKKQALKFAANSDNASIFNITDYIFSETGILVKDAYKETRFQWNAFIKKQENKDYILLFLHSTNALIIPQKIFQVGGGKRTIRKIVWPVYFF